MFLPTIIFRHKRENLKKCSLSGLEKNPDFLFFTYPQDLCPIPLDRYVLLSFDGPLLSEHDEGVILLDGTWRYAEKMEKQLNLPLNFPRRSLPKQFITAYPRRQSDCTQPDRGLSSIEALFIAYWMQKRNTNNLLDHYHWKDLFLEKNKQYL